MLGHKRVRYLSSYRRQGLHKRLLCNKALSPARQPWYYQVESPVNTGKEQRRYSAVRCPKVPYFQYVQRCILTHLPLDKMAGTSQTIFSDAFSWLKCFVFWLKFYCNLFLKVKLTKTRIGSDSGLAQKSWQAITWHSSMIHICGTKERWVNIDHKFVISPGRRASQYATQTL